MMDFDTFEDVLDFAILQEKAAQQFYIKLAGEVLDADVQLFYRTLAEEEQIHEKKLRELKRYEYDLNEPDLEALKDSGYLDAMPIPPDISLTDAIRYAIKKERSARMLYRTLGQTCKRKELSELFTELADEEEAHADYFRTEYKELLAE
ncbi:MAG: ferritin family protein [Planctomycetota bacterium]|jgi:rubrerythrin